MTADEVFASHMKQRQIVARIIWKIIEMLPQRDDTQEARKALSELRQELLSE